MSGDPTGLYDHDEPHPDCGQPCDPNDGCEHCALYWERMVREGLWDRERHRWTEAGWREIVRSV